MGDFGGEGEEQPCGMLRIVGNGEQLRFLLGGSHGPICLFESCGAQSGHHTAVGTPLCARGGKGSFLAHFFLLKMCPISTCTPKPCPGHPALLSALRHLFGELGWPEGFLTGQQNKAQGAFSLQKKCFLSCR